MPADVVPVYKVPVEFKRGAAHRENPRRVTGRRRGRR